MPPSVTDHSASRAGQGGNMTSGSFFKVREREEAELQEARQKASIKWLVSKAYSNKPPGNIVEPYYKDHHDKDRLKPAVLHSLANAELYCMSMAALYQDPNYHNLNHWGIIQAMSRKGVFVSEPADCSLTETVLIQDAPLKLSAHMAVIEALMMLYVKEQVVPDRVISAVRRFSKAEEQPAEAEDALLCWVNQSLHAVR
jgi:calmodulin-regulated spectrin-associated protein